MDQPHSPSDQEYNEPNVTRAFLQLVRLIRAHRTRLPASLRYLKEQMDAVNAKKKKHEPQARSFQTTTYYKMVKNQAGILDRISPEAFAALRKYLGKFDLDGDAATTSPPSPQLLSLQVDALRFFRASADEVAQANQDLQGVYRTYRPSLSKPGSLVVGLLQIAPTSILPLQTEEKTIYRTDSEAPEHPDIWRGQLWYADEHCLLIAANKRFPRIQTLTVQDRDDTGRALTLRGSYSGHSTEHSLGVFSSHIYVLRLNDKEARNLQDPAIDASLGHKTVNADDRSRRVSQDIWNRVFPPKSPPIITY